MKQKLSPAVVLPFVTLPLIGLILTQGSKVVFAEGKPDAKVRKSDKPKKPKGKPQNELALKSAFPTIPATDPNVKKALPAGDLAGAKKLLDKPVFVTGTVAKVFVSKSNKVVLLNFAKDYTKALCGAVLAADFGKFPDLTTLEGKKVLLDGKMALYKGAPEVELSQIGGIKVIK